MPDSFCETPDGLVLVANGVDSCLRWDALEPQAEPAGVIRPSVAPSLSGSGLGGIVGDYYAYVRFVDVKGNNSSLSPISAVYSAASTTGSITNASNAAPVGILSPNHGLLTGATVNISGVGGNDGANGTFTITVTGADTFNLDGSAGTGTYLGSGTWESGVSTITYSGVPTSYEPKVARRQILRNTAGQVRTFYVDVDTPDLTSTTFTSARLDDELATQESQALFDDDGASLALINEPPPAHKSVLAHHLGRMFLACEVPYTEGSVAVTFGALSVTGLGTEWSARLAGRYLYVPGATEGAMISAVDTVNQVLTLAVPYTGPTSPYAAYAIRPVLSERRLIYYSEAGYPESWPATNTLSLQEDGDEITGLMPKGSFIYILERRHIYRFTYQNDPAEDGYVFLSCNRGCINNRCWATVDDNAYLLDEAGIYVFTGGQDTESLSIPIQDFFESESAGIASQRINWAAQRFFHCVHYPGQECIRWFVALLGYYLPRHALCYDYRLKRWWSEEFSFPVGSSCLARLQGEPKVFLGGPAGRVLAYAVGTLDGPSPQEGTVSGTVTSATPTSLSDSNASFASSGLAGFPVCITSGRGKGQRRVVASISGARVEVTQPWAITPDTTSVYQLGGIKWLYRSGWFRFAESEVEAPRRVEVTFEPTAHPASMDLKLYLDRSESPLAWGTDYASADASGVASTPGNADLVVDLSRVAGFAQKRMDGRRDYYLDGPRFLSLELKGVSGRDPISIHEIQLDGVSQP